MSLKKMRDQEKALKKRIAKAQAKTDKAKKIKEHQAEIKRRHAQIKKLRAKK